MKRLNRVGLAISAIWLGAFAWILVFKFGDAYAMSLGEWGGFLSGAAVPLALVWLAIGYFLQREELRLNTAALRAQEEQLRRQLSETSTLVANTERLAKIAEQLAFATNDEREVVKRKEQAEAQPLFRSRGGHAQGAMNYIKIRNAGATVTKVSAAAEDGAISIDISPKEVFEGDGEGILQTQGVGKYPFKFSITYTDHLQQARTKSFEMTNPHRFYEI